MSPKQQELKDKHGTPQEFAEAVLKTLGECSWAECQAAVNKYQQEWDDAAAIDMPAARFGDLVITRDGYYGLVGYMAGNGTAADVHLSNGTTCIELISSLQVLPLKVNLPGGSPANFAEWYGLR